MTDRELLVYLMRVDESLWERRTDIENGLNIDTFEMFPDRFEKDEKYKYIKDIIFDHVGIPAEGEREHITGSTFGYCRDILNSFYSEIVLFGNETLTFEELADILIEIGENNGDLTEEQKSIIKFCLGY